MQLLEFDNVPFLLGVAGGSGSGKSTLASALRDELGADLCVVLCFDRYYKDLADRPVAERARVNFDHPDSLDVDLFAAHLDELRAGRGVDVPRYDFANHTRRSASDRIEPRPVVVVEGILLFAVPELAARLDHSVFVRASEDVRLARRIARDRVARGRSEASVRTQFAATVGPMHDRFVAPSATTADEIVSGEQPFASVVAELSALVGERIRKRI